MCTDPVKISVLPVTVSAANRWCPSSLHEHFFFITMCIDCCFRLQFHCHLGHFETSYPFTFLEALLNKLSHSIYDFTILPPNLRYSVDCSCFSFHKICVDVLMIPFKLVFHPSQCLKLASGSSFLLICTLGGSTGWRKYLTFSTCMHLAALWPSSSCYTVQGVKQ